MSERARYGRKDSDVVSRKEGNGRRVREACQDIKVSMREAISLGMALDRDRREERGGI